MLHPDYRLSASLLFHMVLFSLVLVCLLPDHIGGRQGCVLHWNRRMNKLIHPLK